jgi:hypothetical protein
MSGWMLALIGAGVMSLNRFAVEGSSLACA